MPGMYCFVVIVTSLCALTNTAAGQYSQAVQKCAQERPLQTCLTGTEQYPAESCNDVIDKNSYSESGIYHLQCPEGDSFIGYCVFDDLGACGTGPWNLVMRIDGSKRTFSYDSEFWMTTDVLNEESVAEGLSSSSELKLDSYWFADLDSMCLGMRVNGQTNWLKVPVNASSLHALLADGQEHHTNLGRDAWKSLIDTSSLQMHCNREGLNMKVAYWKVRIGIVSNQEYNCKTPDSYIGFGVGRNGHNVRSVGNFARWRADNGDRDTTGFGFILIKTPRAFNH